jgi:hypothetical protein
MSTTRIVITVTVLVLAACGESGMQGDASTDPGEDGHVDAPVDVASEPDGAVDPVPDVPPDERVLIGCYEVEIAVNVDASEGGSMFRWYGGFYLADESAPVTGLTVTHAVIVEDGVERGITDPWLMGETIDELPRVQRRVFGKIVVTVPEHDACVSSGPSLTRGHPATDDVLVRLSGGSDQGPWSATCTVDDEDVLHTCHTGISGMAEGSVFNDLFPDTTPYWQIDLSATVRFADPVDVVDPVVTSLVLHGEGASETWTAPDPTADPCTWSTPPECLVLGYMGEGRLPEELCPDIATGFPPELVLIYSGTAGAHAFSGASPAGQCAYGDI